MKNKKLPNFVVAGTLKHIIEIETLLILLGYNLPDEMWNGVLFRKIDNLPENSFVAFKACGDKRISYFSTIDPVRSYIRFYPNQIKEMVKFIEDNQNK